MHYHWNWAIFLQGSTNPNETWLAYLVSGLGWTLATALCAWAIALSVGAAIGTLRTAGGRFVAVLCAAWVEIFRNIPLLVQMFLWFFVLPELVPEQWGDAIKQMPPPWAAFVPAVLCLGFYTSIRIAEQVRAGIQSLPRGQMMAATALGLRRAQAYRYVILPVTFRIILPPLTSEFMNCLKNSSVALTIGLLELTGRAKAMQEFTFQVFEAFAAATLIYLVTNVIIVFGMRRLERKVRVPGFLGAANVQVTGH
ncbi:MAG TPA: amino acid ABC transporter permease [Burkholderiales bacterium]|nr:amino acid ABC transporter permease [Burkholderiales bacterium]